MDYPISPLDGKYAEKLAELSYYFSDYNLTKCRIYVQLYHARKLDEVFGHSLNDQENYAINRLLYNFRTDDYKSVKYIEDEIKHDVKACEAFLRRYVPWQNPNRVHFGLTSEDVNNLAYSRMLLDFKEEILLPSWKGLLRKLQLLCNTLHSAPMPARTHGQHASPTTAGKEFAVFLGRFKRVYDDMCSHRFMGKFNGATGNYSALMEAAPNVDWEDFGKKFIWSLGVDWNPCTTQIEDGDSIGKFLHIITCFNRVAIDLCRDMWLYVSYGYFKQKCVDNEVGSSTMPHKINPIHFENAEGNLQLGNVIANFIEDKISNSRMQRDLSSSTVMRNIGTPMGHHHLAWKELMAGLDGVEFDSDFCIKELQSHPELLSEPIQTILKVCSTDDTYSTLKNASRGRQFNMDDFIKNNGIDDDSKWDRISALKVENYIGAASKITLDMAKSIDVALGPEHEDDPDLIIPF